MLAAFTLLALLAAGCGSRMHRASGRSGAAGAGEELYEFELTDARTGKLVRLSDYRGRAVLVHYFTTWCAPCEADFQTDAVLLDEYGPRGQLQILGVALDLEAKKLLPAFLDVHGLQYPVLLADERSLHGLTTFGPVQAIPASFLLDADGRLVERFSGVVPIERLRRRLRDLAP